MGFLDNSSITVDAVLTKKGRDILKNGGSLNITQFTLSDTGVDYTLWNPNHPDGSAYYGASIENLPMLEASVHAEDHLRNRLMNLNQNAVAVPHLTIGGELNSDGKSLTFEQTVNSNKSLIVTLDGYTSTLNPGLGKYMVIQDPSIVTPVGLTSDSNLSGTSQMFLAEQDIPHASQYSFTQQTIILHPEPQLDGVKGRQSNIFFVDIETGVYNSIVITNNVTEPVTNLIDDSQVIN